MPGGSRKSAKSRVALMLAVGTPQQEIAAECRVHDRTIRRWLSNPAYRQRISTLRGEMVNAVIGKLTNAMTAATDRLIELVGSTNPAVALKASIGILDFAANLRKSVEIEDRILRLEGDRREQTRQASRAIGNGTARR